MIRKIALGVTGAALIGALVIYAQIPRTEEAALARVAAIAERSTKAGRLVGVSMALVAPGEVLWTYGAGSADLVLGRPMTADTAMPIGSISKVFIGATAASLIAADAFDPATSLAEVWPEAPQNARDITFAELATHKAGVVDSDAIYEGVAYDYEAARHPMPLETFVKGYVTPGSDLYRPDHQMGGGPEHAYEYSNVGAALGAWMLGAAKGEDFADLSQAQVFAPLGMSATWDATKVENRAKLYEDIGDGWAEIPPYGLATWPDGGLNTSANDLARFLAIVMGDGAFGDEQLWPAEAVNALTEIISTNDSGETLANGLFWAYEQIDFMVFSLNVDGHNGGDPGLLTFMYRDRETGRGAVMMLNGVPESLRGQIDIARMLTGLLDAPGATR